MGADLQTHAGLLKDFFENHINVAVNNKNPLKDVIKFQKIPFGSSEIRYTANVGRNISGTMFGAADSAMPDAGNETYAQVVINQKKNTGRIRLTWETMHDSSKNQWAWKQSRKTEMEGLINSLARKDEYALVTDGRGVLGRVDESDPDGDTTLEMDAPGGITNDNFGNRFAFINMFVGFVNPSTGALRTQASATRKVTAVNSDGTDITLSSATVGTDVANSDYVVQAANSSVTEILDTSYENAWWGVMGIFDDGTYRNNYFGIDRSLYEAYQSYVVASTGALSMDLIQRTIDVVDQKLNGRVSLMLSHHSTRRLVLQIQDADRRYTGEKLVRPDIGTKAVKDPSTIPVGGVELRAIRDFPLDVLMFIDVEQADLVAYVSEPGKWADESGGVLKQVGTGSTLRDSFEAYYRIRKQNHARQPGVAARLDGITGQTLVIVRAP